MIAVLTSGVALRIAFHLRWQSQHARTLRAGSTVVMDVVTVGMHYMGMPAVVFPLGSVCGTAYISASAKWLALVIVIVMLVVLAIVLIISVLDLRIETRTASLANSLAVTNRELAHLALHDNLTKLSNRILLGDRLTQAVRTTECEKYRFAFMFMDPDGFEAINDVCGHHVGDLLLIGVAQHTGAWARQQDTAACIGGDEFVVLVYIDDPEDAGILASVLLEVMREPFMAGGHELCVPTSIGIATYPGDDSNQHDLPTNADATIYHAKGLDRNAYSFFKPSMSTDVHQQSQPM